LRTVLTFLFSHRFLAIARWEIHFLGIRIWNAITFQRRRLRDFLATRQSPMFLNLGSGPRGIDDVHWVNIDGFCDRNVHYLLDLGRPLPFPDESFDAVFSEHVLEHFSQDEAERLAQEIYRILRPGGCLRVIVPDAERVLLSYFEAPNELVSRRGGGAETPMEIVNLYFRQRYEHQFLYDWPTMRKVLLRAGFDDVLRSAFGRNGNCPPAVLDDPKYEWESLYAEAVKSPNSSQTRS
jgi:predicted SAM-dependent methyltransferase